MKVFITGATGFLGYHITVACLAAGHEVLLLRRPSSRSLFTPEVESRVTWVTQTANDEWRNAVREYAPDVLIHAAWGGVAAAGRNDATLQRANVEMTLDIYSVAPFKQIIALGSQDEYGQYSDCIDESHPLNPVSEYARAKIACCEALSRMPVEWQWIRVFSMYGEHQQSNWLIPSIIEKCRSGAAVMQTTAGEQVYSYLYAPDFGRAIASMVGVTGKSGIYNIASAHAMPLHEIFDRVKRACHSDIVFDKSLPYRPNQTMKMLGDCSRLRAAFGEFEFTTFEDGLAALVTQHVGVYNA